MLVKNYQKWYNFPNEMKKETRAMLTRREACSACLRFSDAFEDYPFDDPNWTCMRHRSNLKIFAAIFERNGKIWINVKAEPLKADFWQTVFPAVLPGWHMNKRHWISIVLDGSMSDADICMLIEDSYHLTSKRRRAKSAH